MIGENGEKIGATPTARALGLAREAGLDLVEVNPKEGLSIAKIMDYGQFKYEKEKKAHKQKLQQKKVDTKGIRLSARISAHDFDVRVGQADKFLKRGDKLKVDLLLKGRERQHPEKAVEMIKAFVAALEKGGDLNLIREQDLTRQGGRYTITLINKKG